MLSLLCDLPPELSLKCAGLVTCHRARVALCHAHPPLGLSAICDTRPEFSGYSDLLFAVAMWLANNDASLDESSIRR